MIEKIPCPICELLLNDMGNAGNRDATRFDCPNCGRFEISRTALVTLQRPLSHNERARAVVSHAIQRMQRANEWPQLSTYTLDQILTKNYLPTAAEQGENLLVWLGERTTPGVALDQRSHYMQAVLGSMTHLEVGFIVQAMVAKGYIVKGLEFEGVFSLSLSFDGWEVFQTLVRESSAGPRIFMAMAYANTSLADIVEQHFKSAAEQAGFTLHRLDDNPEAGLMDARMRVEIRRASCLVADLSDHNPGAYWEAGFAEGIGKPVIYTCEKSVFETEKSHFDTNHHHTILWEREAPEKAAQQLKATIRATLPDTAKIEDD